MVTQIKADLKKRCMEKQGRLIGPEDDAENELIYTYLNDKGIVKTSENFQNAFKALQLRGLSSSIILLRAT